MVDIDATTLPRLLVIGANHRSSTLALRDRLFIDDPAVPAVLDRLRRSGLGQAVVLSTCDRVEVIAADAGDGRAAGAVLEALADHAGLDAADLEGNTYLLHGVDAVRHLFAVSASLDSLVIGEPQVLGQVKAAHRMARDAGMTDGVLEAVLQAAYTTAKRVRSETAIGERPVSISAAAVQIARDLHGDLDRCTGLLVGAGDMGELIARDMQSAGLANLTLTHPTAGRAEAMARSLDCHVAPFTALADLLPEADIVLTAVGTRQHVLTADILQVALRQRRRKPVFLVDAGIPGDIEPAVNRIDEAFLYDLNDLERVAMEGRANRQSESRDAWRIVDAEVAHFLRGRAERAAVPALVRLRAHFEAARESALAAAGGDAAEATRLLVNRLLHDPSEVMRGMAGGSGADAAPNGTGEPLSSADWFLAESMLQRLFRLGDGGDAPADAAATGETDRQSEPSENKEKGR